METQILNEFKIQSIFRLKEGLRMVVKALDFIDEKELWQLPVENGISLGNQILHSCGNMRQYIISSLGDQIDSRKRDLEFKTKSSKINAIGFGIASKFKSLKKQKIDLCYTLNENHWNNKTTIQLNIKDVF